MRTIQKPVVFGQAGFQSPSPHSPRGFAARLIVGSAAKTLFRVRLQSRQLRRLMSKEKYPSKFSPQVEAIVFIILQILFTMCTVLQIGEYINNSRHVARNYPQLLFNKL